MPDVAHNLAYFQTMASGFTRNEVIAAAEEARDRARKPKGVPNPYSGPTGELMEVSADQRGLVMSDNTFLRWKQPVQQVGRLSAQPGRKERLVGKVIAAL